MAEGARREQSRAETMDESRYQALCVELEGNIKEAIAAFLDEFPEAAGERTEEVCLAVPAVLIGLFIDFIARFGRLGVPVRVACAETIASTIAANRDEIADLVRARRRMN